MGVGIIGTSMYLLKIRKQNTGFCALSSQVYDKWTAIFENTAEMQLKKKKKKDL